MGLPASTRPPIPRTSLIGRTGERSSGSALLLDTAAPLVTLTGPGGVGKTRLALSIAEDVAGSFADEVVWVDLSPLRDPSLVTLAVASGVGATLSPDQPVTKELTGYLRSRQVLLLLDNCEHLVGAVAELVSWLLSGCPGLQVLATSRVPLHVRGEHVLEVGPLPVPSTNMTNVSWQRAENEAMSLFIERARAVKPDFQVTGSDADAVAALCRSLDGLPLAIELAAARVKLFSLDSLVAMMDKRLPVLRHGTRDAPPRHQTMSETIAWSYQLLDEEAAALFRQLAIFVGGFDLQGAASVTSREVDQIAEQLETLLDHSLVRRERLSGPNPRFGLLETIREFALNQLVSSGEYEEVARRHAHYFAGLLNNASMWTSGSLEWRELPGLGESDLPNNRAALAWFAENDSVAFVRMAGDMSALWHEYGFLNEGRDRLEEALAIAERLGDSLPSTNHAMVFLGAGVMAVVQGDTRRAQTAFKRCMEVSDTNDGFMATAAKLLLGGSMISEGHYDEAEPLVEQAMATWHERAEPLWEAVALFHLGVIAYARHEWTLAFQRLSDSVRMEDDFNMRLEAVDPLHYLALIAGLQENFGDAARLVIDILQRLRERGSVRALADGIADAATLASFRGDCEVSARLFGAASGLLEGSGARYPQPARTTYERTESHARQHLGMEHWTVAFAAGHSMSVESALKEAEQYLATVALASSHERHSETSPTPVPDSPADMHEAWVPGKHTGDQWSPAGFDLTRREHEVLVLLCQRLTDAEIAARLFISPRTAPSHVANLLGKLRAANRREAAGIAVRNGLIR